MGRSISAKALPGDRLDVEWAEGTLGVLDYLQELWQPVFESLRDPERIAEVGLDPFGAVCWPNADAMCEQTQRGSTMAR
jgi:hypothetical protein